MPVTLPPGRARLSTRPASDGIGPAARITMGIVLVAFLAARLGMVPGTTMRVSTFETHQLAARLSEETALSLSISLQLSKCSISFDVAKLAQSEPKCLGVGWNH